MNDRCWRQRFACAQEGTRRYRCGECSRCGSAAIVLTSPGLSVIVEATDLSRKIFRRMKNYVIYRIACTLQLLVFSTIFVGKMCVFVSRPMKIVTFLRKKVTPQNGLLIFLCKETHSETKSWKSSRIFDEKSYNNNGKPWKSSRILCVNLNFFIFLSFSSFSFSFLQFLPVSFSFFQFLSVSTSFFQFLPVSFMFVQFLSFSFIFFLSCSFMFFHVLSCSFMFFHYLSFSFIVFPCFFFLFFFFLGCSKSFFALIASRFPNKALM